MSKKDQMGCVCCKGLIGPPVWRRSRCDLGVCYSPRCASVTASVCPLCVFLYERITTLTGFVPECQEGAVHLQVLR